MLKDAAVCFCACCRWAAPASARIVAQSVEGCLKLIIGLRMTSSPDQDDAYRSKTEMWKGVAVLVTELEKGG